MSDYKNDPMKQLVYKHDVIVALAEKIDEPIDFVGALKNVPIVDAVEVKHGKPKVVKRKQWLSDYKNLDGTLFEKSKVLVEYEEDFCPFCGKALGDFNSYCGNCGAKMDG